MKYEIKKNESISIHFKKLNISCRNLTFTLAGPRSKIPNQGWNTRPDWSQIWLPGIGSGYNPDWWDRVFHHRSGPFLAIFSRDEILKIFLFFQDKLRFFHDNFNFSWIFKSEINWGAAGKRVTTKEAKGVCRAAVSLSSGKSRGNKGKQREKIHIQIRWPRWMSIQKNVCAAIIIVMTRLMIII